MRLFVSDDNLGSLNPCSRRPYAFGDESEQEELLFVSPAADAYASARKIDGRTQAVVSRDLIGQAKGVLMERCTVSDENAFSVLTRVSQNSRRPLREVAHELATTGRLAASEPPT